MTLLRTLVYMQLDSHDDFHEDEGKVSRKLLKLFYIYLVSIFGLIWNIFKKKAATSFLFKRLIVTHLASCFSASAHSSSSPMSTADTSMYGSHTVKPRPIRSMAVRRMVLWAGSLGLGGCSSRKVRALPAERNKSEGFIRKQQEFEISLWGLSIRQY